MSRIMRVVVMVAVVVLAGCAHSHTDEHHGAGRPAGPVPRASLVGTPVDLTQLAPGMCSSDRNEVRLKDAVVTVPCEQPHFYEVYAVTHLPDPATATYPDQPTLVRRTRDACQREYERMLPADERVHGVFVLFPYEAEAWAAGNRRVVCGAFALTLEPTSGRIRWAT